MSIPCLEKPMKKCNCSGDRCGACSPGYECCQQTDSNYGLCIDKSCECDKRLGLPPKKSRDKFGSISEAINTVTAKFTDEVSTNEGYTVSCDDWRNSTIVFGGIFFVLLIVTLFYRYKKA